MRNNQVTINVERFGQLILNLCGPKNLFTIEDEDSLKLLEENKIRYSKK